MTAGAVIRQAVPVRYGGMRADIYRLARQYISITRQKPHVRKRMCGVISAASVVATVAGSKKRPGTARARKMAGSVAWPWPASRRVAHGMYDYGVQPFLGIAAHVSKRGPRK